MIPSKPDWSYLSVEDIAELERAWQRYLEKSKPQVD